LRFMRRRRLRPRKGLGAASKYRGLAYTVCPREIGLRSAFRKALHGYLSLIGGNFATRSALALYAVAALAVASKGLWAIRCTVLTATPNRTAILRTPSVRPGAFSAA